MLLTNIMFKKITPLKDLIYIYKTMSTTKTTLTDLPNELILEIANNLTPKDYVSLYSTCHDMRAVLKMDLGKKRKEHERIESKNQQESI